FDDVDRVRAMNLEDGPPQAHTVHQQSGSRKSRVRQSDDLDAIILAHRSAARDSVANHGDAMAAPRERASKCLRETADAAVRIGGVLVAEETDVHHTRPTAPITALVSSIAAEVALHSCRMRAAPCFRFTGSCPVSKNRAVTTRRSLTRVT